MTVCPSCSVTTRLVYPVMYHDPGRGFAVYFLPRVEQEKLERDDTLNGLLDPAASYSRLRLVDDYSHLCEKIRLFELGLNDRAMELFKACTALSMMGQEKTDAFVPDSMVFEEESEGRMRLYLRPRRGKQASHRAGGLLPHHSGKRAFGCKRRGRGAVRHDRHAVGAQRPEGSEQPDETAEGSALNDRRTPERKPIGQTKSSRV